MSKPEWIEVFACGEIFLLRNTEEAIRKFREAYTFEKDVLGWTLVSMVRKGLVTYSGGDQELLKAAENTLKILGKTWEDVYKIIKEE